MKRASLNIASPPPSSVQISNGTFSALKWRGLQLQLKIKSPSVHLTTAHHPLCSSKQRAVEKRGRQMYLRTGASVGISDTVHLVITQ